MLLLVNWGSNPFPGAILLSNFWAYFMKKGINCGLSAVFSKRAKFGNKFLLVKNFTKEATETMMG
jgi:hypothetical protein